MLIRRPEIQIKEGKAYLVSRVEFQRVDTELPAEIYYAYPDSYQDKIIESNEPMAAALLLVAMLLGEELEISGPVSPRFARGLLEFGRLFHVWLPGEFHEPRVSFEHLANRHCSDVKSSVGLAFSGGVDSLYSFRNHVPNAQPNAAYQLSHGLFLHGHDIELKEREAYDSAFSRFRTLFEEFDLELIPVETNAKEFSKYRVDWAYASGGSLLGAGLGLAPLLSAYIISSDYSYHELHPSGTNPISDPLLALEDLEIVHFGAHMRHSEKMSEHAHWSVAHQYLRVCINRPTPLNGQNCSRCNKCLANMVRFELLGTLGQFQTFEKPFSPGVFFHWALIGQIGSQAMGEITRMAVEKRRWGIYLGMQAVKFGSWVNAWGRRLIKSFFSNEDWANIKRRFYERKSRNKFLSYFTRFS